MLAVAFNTLTKSCSYFISHFLGIWFIIHIFHPMSHVEQWRLVCEYQHYFEVSHSGQQTSASDVQMHPLREAHHHSRSCQLSTFLDSMGFASCHSSVPTSFHLCLTPPWVLACPCRHSRLASPVGLLPSPALLPTLSPGTVCWSRSHFCVDPALGSLVLEQPI